MIFNSKNIPAFCINVSSAGIPIELFKTIKNDAIKVLHSIYQ